MRGIYLYISMTSSVLIVNAKVDSMGVVVDGEVGTGNKSSPHKAAIEKVQAELRKECGVRNEWRRELDFLEKGGNPLEFKLGIVASFTIQTTSSDQFVTSEAKVSLEITASPHGDYVESSGRPAATPWDPNGADNISLFDAENDFSEGGRKLFRSSVSLPRKAYKRRYRSRRNRDGARSSSTAIIPAQGCQGTSLPSHRADNQNIISNRNSKPTSPRNDILPKTVVVGQICQDIELDCLKSFHSTEDQVKGVSVDTASDLIAPENPACDKLNQQSLSVFAETPKPIVFSVPQAIQTEEMSSATIECQPILTIMKVQKQSESYKMNSFGRKIGDDMFTDTHSNASRGTKVLDSASSCIQTCPSIDRNNDSEICTRVRNLEPNVNFKTQTILESAKIPKEMKNTEVVNSSDFVNKDHVSICQSKLDADSLLLPRKESDQVESAVKDKVNDQDVNDGKEAHGPTQLEYGVKSTKPLVDNPQQPKGTFSVVRTQETFDISEPDLHEVGCSNRASAVPLEAQTYNGSDSKLTCKIDEDSVLEEAQIIEAKRKRTADLSDMTSLVEIYQNSHWDYVLEEMMWLANDFAQERIWKLAAASQISYRVAASSWLRKQERSSGLDAKAVAHTLAKSVMEFWQSIELQVHESSKELEQNFQKKGALSVQAYAFRFLKSDKQNIFSNRPEMPLTPDRISDPGILDLSWEDSLTEENLFYTVTPGDMETSRMAIESHIARYERIGSYMQEEVETSACDSAADFESRDCAYDEDEGQSNIFSISMAFEGRKSSRHGQKKWKHYARPYKVGSDLLPKEKRPGSNINVSIPRKRMRTASRRVISPFSAGASVCIPVPDRTDASSCDTNSFQDDLSTLLGSIVSNSLEIESAGEFEKQLTFDYAEVSRKPKKKKKAKHLNATYEHKWQVNSSFQNEQFPRDHFQKRTEIHQFEANGNNALLGQPLAKKPKLRWQSQDNTFDNIPPSAMSVPSPVGSEMSNMSDSNKFIKMLGGRDRDRKNKLLKMPSGQSGSGSVWSLFEDQTLVVLAHDLGPNWELVTDAFNSILRLKCIFRKAKDCKERHFCLMDRNSGDGADSADDSGSSQPYPSTLPGIPKGSARQLFQRLQGPVEEDTLKSHFEKIIMIGQKQHFMKSQNDNQDPKQFQRPDSSHAIALSQVCPNNPNGGPVLTPLELCDASISGTDVLRHGYQGHPSILACPNPSTMTQMLPASGATAALQGASNTMMSSNFSSSPGPLNTSTRDARYGIPRSGSLPADEHQMTTVTDRGAHMLSSGNGIGMMSNSNRSMSIPRSGLQGIPSSSMVNSGSAISPTMSLGNMRTGAGAGQRSSLVRPPEAMSKSQGVSHFGGLSSSCSTSPPVSSYPLHYQSSHPVSPQQSQVLSPHQSHLQGAANHPSNTQQQAYAFRLAKERHLQLRRLQQQQFAASTSLISPVQPQPQLPMSSSQVNPRTSSPPASFSPSTPGPSTNAIPQHQPKHQMPTQGVERSAESGASGLGNQIGEPRPRQQLQPLQANKQHPQQRQQLQGQQAKVLKRLGRGNLPMHQNIPTDVSLPNGVPKTPGTQSLEKGEPTTNSMQSRGLGTGSAQQSNQTLPQLKMYSSQGSSSSKHLQPMTQFDNSCHGHDPPVAPVDQPSSSLSVAGSNNHAPPR